MSAPRRVQRSRGRRWRMPEGAVYVGRPTIWGNPFRVTRSSDFHGLPGSWFLMGEDGQIHHPDEDTQSSARQKAVELYAARLMTDQDTHATLERARSELAGHDLVCWCPLQEPCHADVLLELANHPALAQPRVTRWSPAPRAARDPSRADRRDRS